jgi:hypothetical protein
LANQQTAAAAAAAAAAVPDPHALPTAAAFVSVHLLVPYCPVFPLQQPLKAQQQGAAALQRLVLLAAGWAA